MHWNGDCKLCEREAVKHGLCNKHLKESPTYAPPEISWSDWLVPLVQRLQNSILTRWIWSYWQHEDTGMSYGHRRKPVAVSSGELVMPARCPHCGAKAELESWESMYDKTMERQLYGAAVVCSNRLLCGAAISVILNDENAARTQCVEQWNRRHNDGSELRRE